MLPIDPKFLTIIIFMLAYIFIISFYNRKYIVVWISVIVLLLLGILTPMVALKAVNWNVIMLYFGMLFVSEVFMFSKMPDYLATLFTSKAKKVSVALIIICAFSGFLSIFLENVAVVLLVAPIALSIAKKIDTNPVPLFVGIAISSNLQGVATLIGDPPSMLLAGFAKMNFNDFFFLKGKPSIFFAVEIGAIVSLLVLYYFFHKHDAPMHELEKENYISIVPTLLVTGLVVSLILGSFLTTWEYTTGFLCVVFGIFSFIWYFIYMKGKEVKKFLLDMDWLTGIFLIGLFVLVQSLVLQGVMDDIANFILGIGGGNKLFLYMLLVGTAVVISAFVDNVPFLLAMLPVVQIITHNIGTNPYLFYFGLLIGASVGGNITPIGASANVVAMGITRQHGYPAKFWDFVKIGLPFTIVSVLASSLFLWFVFA